MISSCVTLISRQVNQKSTAIAKTWQPLNKSRRHINSHGSSRIHFTGTWNRKCSTINHNIRLLIHITKLGISYYGHFNWFSNKFDLLYNPPATSGIYPRLQQTDSKDHLNKFTALSDISRHISSLIKYQNFLQILYTYIWRCKSQSPKYKWEKEKRNR